MQAVHNFNTILCVALLTLLFFFYNVNLLEYVHILEGFAIPNIVAAAFIHLDISRFLSSVQKNIFDDLLISPQMDNESIFVMIIVHVG